MFETVDGWRSGALLQMDSVARMSRLEHATTIDPLYEYYAGHCPLYSSSSFNDISRQASHFQLYANLLSEML
jgi:hypothetical protein